MSIVFIERLFVKEAVGVDTEGIQRVADRVPKLTARRQNENAAGLNLIVMDAPLNDLGYPLGFFLHGRPLEHMHLARGILLPRQENARRSPLIVSYQIPRHFNYESWAPTTLAEFLVVSVAMQLAEFSDPLGVSMFERVDRLVLVANHRQIPGLSQQIQQNLFRPIKVLVLINEDVVELAPVERRGVVSQIPQALGDEFADEHRLVEPKPLGQLDLKRLIGGIFRPAGCLRLETRPRRVEGLKTTFPVLDCPEARTVQVFEQKPFLKGQKRSRHAPSGFENLLVPQQTKAESVQRSGPHRVDVIYTETGQCIFKVLCSRAREGAD